jgi:hypothetical protein
VRDPRTSWRRWPKNRCAPLPVSVDRRHDAGHADPRGANAFEPAQKDLLEHIDFAHVECLNEHPTKNIAYAIKQGLAYPSNPKIDWYPATPRLRRQSRVQDTRALLMEAESYTLG